MHKNIDSSNYYQNNFYENIIRLEIFGGKIIFRILILFIFNLNPIPIKHI